MTLLPVQTLLISSDSMSWIWVAVWLSKSYIDGSDKWSDMKWLT